MSLGENTIYSWDDIKFFFLKNYQDYCKINDVDEIFSMQQMEEKSIEEFLERFLYNYHKSRGEKLDERTIRTIFLKGLREECIDTLNLLSVCDIYKKPFADIAKLCRTYSRSQAKVGKRLRENSRYYVSKNKKSASNVVTRVELGNLLENFKTNILNTISDQLDTLKIKRKKEEKKVSM